MTTTITTTITIALAALRKRNACNALLAFTESIATDGAITFELTPLAWVWLEAGGRNWASWLGLECPSLQDADLRGADLRGADFEGANLSGAILSGANLSGASLYGTNLSGAILSGAILSGANIYSANLRYAEYRAADLRDAIHMRSDDAERRKCDRSERNAREAKAAWRREVDNARQAGAKAFADYYPWEAPEDIGPDRFHFGGLGKQSHLSSGEKYILRRAFIEGMAETQARLRELPSNPWQQVWFRQQGLLWDLPWWEQPWLKPETVAQLCALIGGAIEE